VKKWADLGMKLIRLTEKKIDFKLIDKVLRIQRKFVFMSNVTETIAYLFLEKILGSYVYLLDRF